MKYQVNYLKIAHSKFLLIVFVCFSSFVAAYSQQADTARSNKWLLSDWYVDVPFIANSSQGLSADQWQKIDPSYVDLSQSDSTWVGGKGRIGYTIAAGFGGGLHFKLPERKEGGTNLLLGFNLSFLPGQDFSRYQFRNNYGVVDTISYSSGEPDDYVTRDTNFRRQYEYYSNRVSIGTRFILQSDQSRRFIYYSGIAAQFGISARAVSTVTESIDFIEYTVNSEDGSAGNLTDAGNYNYTTSSRKEPMNTSWNVGIPFGLSYSLGKSSAKVQNVRIGLESQVGILKTNIKDVTTDPAIYLSAGLTFKYILR